MVSNPTRRIGWRLKQLLPRTFWTVYGDADGWHFCIWRMWLGRCYDVTDIITAPAAPSPGNYVATNTDPGAVRSIVDQHIAPRLTGGEGS